MRGLCHECLSSNTEITISKTGQPICNSCKNPGEKTGVTTTEAVILLNRLIGVETDLKKLQIYEFIKNELMKPKPKKKITTLKQ